MKEAAYKDMVHLVLAFGSPVWDPHYDGLNGELEKVQKCAALRFVTRNYTFEEGSMAGILAVKWETLQKRMKDNRLILHYKDLKGKARMIRRC